MSTSYSKTPLAKKLGLKEGQAVSFLNPPLHYFDLFSPFPDHLNIKERPRKEGLDFAHLFFTEEKEFKKAAKKYKSYIKKNGCLWISWPKGTSQIETNLKFGLIKSFLMELGLIDVKVASLDDDWSALKFMYRIKDR